MLIARTPALSNAAVTSLRLGLERESLSLRLLPGARGPKYVYCMLIMYIFCTPQRNATLLLLLRVGLVFCLPTVLGYAVCTISPKRRHVLFSHVAPQAWGPHIFCFLPVVVLEHRRSSNWKCSVSCSCGTGVFLCCTHSRPRWQAQTYEVCQRGSSPSVKTRGTSNTCCLNAKHSVDHRRWYLLRRQTASLTSQNPIHCASPDMPCMVPCLAAATCPNDPAPWPTITLVEAPHSEMASRISLEYRAKAEDVLSVIRPGPACGDGVFNNGDRRMGHSGGFCFCWWWCSSCCCCYIVLSRAADHAKPTTVIYRLYVRGNLNFRFVVNVTRMTIWANIPIDNAPTSPNPPNGRGEGAEKNSLLFAAVVRSTVAALYRVDYSAAWQTLEGGIFALHSSFVFTYGILSPPLVHLVRTCYTHVVRCSRWPHED